MATWTIIPDTSLEPGKPIRSIDALALRDNPIAIAEAASGAPAISLAAIVAALASVPAGSVGSYMFAKRSATGDVAFGATLAGSALVPTSALTGFAVGDSGGAFTTVSFGVGAAQAGTWRAMGTYDYAMSGVGTSLFYGATLWLRIA